MNLEKAEAEETLEDVPDVDLTRYSWNSRLGLAKKNL